MRTHRELPGDGPDSISRALISERRQLINIAYRLLGSLTDAEDVVQETYARWYAMSQQEQESIENPAAWLTTVATRICLDQLRSARSRRERYVGDWLPEPLPDRTDWFSGPSSYATTDPADRVTLDESVTMAFLVVLDSMTPAERVAFVLHDVFRFPYSEVSKIVGRTDAACRQLAASARRRLGTSPLPATTTQQTDLVRQFRQAWEAKDVEAIVGILDPEVTAVGDGGGIATVFPPTIGPEPIAMAALGLLEQAPGLTIVERSVNGQPGLVTELNGATLAVMAFDVVDGLIKRIWVIRNPEKLRPWMINPTDPR